MVVNLQVMLNVKGIKNILRLEFVIFIDSNIYFPLNRCKCPAMSVSLKMKMTNPSLSPAFDLL